MFGRKKRKQVEQDNNQGNQAITNKMDDAQKQAFLDAMSGNKFEDNVEDKTVFKTRAEKRALSEGYTRPVAPIPVKGDDTQKIVNSTKVEQKTLQINLQNIQEETLDLELDRLYEMLAEVQDFKGTDYTIETWQPFADAYIHALKVYQKDDVQLDELLIVKETLKLAKQQLVKR